MFDDSSKKIIVALYKRVSTDEQVANGHSLDEQERIMRNYCETFGYTVYKVYSDEGFSGSETSKRQAFNQMMEDMKKKKFNKIIALKLDRMTRDLCDFVQFVKDTDKYNCGFEFVLEKFDTTTPTGRMIMYILGVFAQFERDIIRQRTKIGIEGAIDKGHYGGPIPFGYKKDKDSKLYLIDEETAPIVKEIFDLCLKGKTYQQIANIMEEKYSFVTYTRRDKHTGEVTKKRKSWRDCTIGTILNNKVYYGVYESQKKNKEVNGKEKTGHIPPIISKEIFEDCQVNIERNSRNYYRNKKYLFMQKLVCPKCGRIMACNGTKKPNGKEYLYYKCKDCKTRFREDLIEETLIKKLSGLLQFYLITHDNLIPIDDDMLEKLKNGKTDNTIRYAFDTLTIDQKIDNYNFLDGIWKVISYEEKCDFIYEFIDTIKLKQRTIRGEKTIELLQINARPRYLKQITDLFKQNILDRPLCDGRINLTTYKSRAKAEQYIEVLRDKYNIEVIDGYNQREYLTPDVLKDVFKIIKIESNNFAEKNGLLYLRVIT